MQNAFLAIHRFLPADSAKVVKAWGSAKLFLVYFIPLGAFHCICLCNQCSWGYVTYVRLHTFLFLGKSNKFGSFSIVLFTKIFGTTRNSTKTKEFGTKK